MFESLNFFNHQTGITQHCGLMQVLRMELAYETTMSASTL